MAEITPITREEFYLAKAGGQNVPVPSAVTREEYYLEKLSNDNVDVPTPVTRREKFLYFASGGEIDLPSEEKMTRLERLIAKAGGMDVTTPTAVTRLEKFWANVEDGGWKTITGVLPLTFTAKGGNAVDWVIEGNDNVGKNLMPVIPRDQVLNGLTITVNNGEITINGTATAVTNLSIAGTDVGFDANTQYIFSGIDSGSKASYYMVITLRRKSDNTFVNQTMVTNQPVTLNSEGAEFIWKWARIAVENGAVCDNVKFKPMLRLAETSADFEPHQQGAGERTKNLFDVSKFGNGNTHTSSGNLNFDISNQTVIVNLTSTVTYPQVYIQSADDKSLQLEELETYTISLYKENVPEGSSIYLHLRASYNGGVEQVFDRIDDAKTITIPSGWADWRQLLIVQGEGLTYENCKIRIGIVKGSTAPQNYIPHGYEIPLTISQTGQPDKNYDIYIGDSPLTEGETVSKTSTGVDIELFEGENTVSTTLYNKPTMEIKYKKRR